MRGCAVKNVMDENFRGSPPLIQGEGLVVIPRLPPPLYAHVRIGNHEKMNNMIKSFGLYLMISTFFLKL